MIEAVVFDVDGTLVSTREEYRHWIIGKTLNRFRMSVSEEEMDQFWFEGGRDKTIHEWGINHINFWKVFRTYEFVEERRKYTFPYDDLSMIDELSARKCKTAVLTAALEHIARMNLN